MYIYMEKNICEKCKKCYKERNGLKRHRKNCNILEEEEVSLDYINGRMKKWVYFFNVHYELLEKVFEKEDKVFEKEDQVFEKDKDV
jgi:hypothetical protein